MSRIALAADGRVVLHREWLVPLPTSESHHAIARARRLCSGPVDLSTLR